MTNPTQPAEGMPELPIYAWASIKAPLVIHHQVKDLWLKVSAERVENYAEPLVLLEDALAYGRQCAAHKALPELPEPTCWALTSQLQERETTCSGRMWFVNPGNSAWQPIYTADQLIEYARQCVLAAQGFTKE